MAYKEAPQGHIVGIESRTSRTVRWHTEAYLEDTMMAYGSRSSGHLAVTQQLSPGQLDGIRNEHLQDI
jgi:hypothetical protein